jgi:hypothetical protein
MIIESGNPHPSPDRPAAGGPRPDTVAQPDAEERADKDEDRRRQRELDEGEMGGEA